MDGNFLSDAVYTRIGISPQHKLVNKLKNLNFFVYVLNINIKRSRLKKKNISKYMRVNWTIRIRPSKSVNWTLFPAVLNDQNSKGEANNMSSWIKLPKITRNPLHNLIQNRKWFSLFIAISNSFSYIIFF